MTIMPSIFVEAVAGKPRQVSWNSYRPFSHGSGTVEYVNNASINFCFGFGELTAVVSLSTFASDLTPPEQQKLLASAWVVGDPSTKEEASFACLWDSMNQIDSGLTIEKASKFLGRRHAKPSKTAKSFAVDRFYEAIEAFKMLRARQCLK